MKGVGKTAMARWRATAALALFAAAATWIGCGRPVNTLQVTETPLPSERVVVRSDLPIRYGDVLSREVKRILQVQVALDNVSDRDQAFEYRWEWTDAAGFELGDTISSWQPAFIPGKGRKLMTSSGPGPNAVNFRLYVR
jgi:uncharacterized protein YcfL